MGRKKKKVSKPWCWYCNREFDDEKILLQHQKAKHFKCHICHKKLFTGPGLQIHCMQVHKENIDKVPNAIKGRDNITLEICGMDNVPEEDIIEHEKQKGNFVEGGDDGDDSPTPPPSSKPTPTGTIHGPLPHIPPPPHFNMMGMMPPMPHMGMMGMMPPMHPMMMPPPGNPMMMMPPPHLMPPLPPTVTPTTPTTPTQSLNNDINSPSHQGIKPLFPAAANLDGEGDKYSSSNGQQKVKIETITSGSKIIHPDEDISLEEFRASHHKYKLHIPPQYSAAPMLNTAVMPQPLMTTTVPQPLMSTQISAQGKMQSLMNVKLDPYQY